MTIALTLRRRIKLGSFAAFGQRIALRYAMTRMTGEEAASYVGHHLKPGRPPGHPVIDDTIALIHQVSRRAAQGSEQPRRPSFLDADDASKGIVDASSARAAVAEVTAE